MIALERKQNIMRFSTLGGVQSAVLGENSITGVWRSDLKWRSHPKRTGAAAEDLANWPDSDQAILRFTQRYGPLEIPPAPGKKFHFSTAQWRNDREGLRFLWGLSVAGGEFGSLGKDENGAFRSHFILEGEKNWSIPAQEGDHFAFEHGQIVYRTATLLRFLMLDLLSVSRRYLRICKNPECSTGFFVADHLREDYCSPACKQWAQRLWKRNWWNENRKTRRKERK